MFYEGIDTFMVNGDWWLTSFFILLCLTCARELSLALNWFPGSQTNGLIKRLLLQLVITCNFAWLGTKVFKFTGTVVKLSFR